MLISLSLSISISISRYLYRQYAAMEDEDVTTIEIQMEEAVKQAISDGEVSLLGFMCDQVLSGAEMKTNKSGYQSIGSSEPSTHLSDKSRATLQRILRPFFKKFDRDNSGSLDMGELRAVFAELGEDVTAKELKSLFADMDKDNSGLIDYNEFVEGVIKYVIKHGEILAQRRAERADFDFENDTFYNNDLEMRALSLSAKKKAEQEAAKSEGGGEEEEEEAEMPDDLAHLPPSEQQKRIKMRSLWMMGMGTLLVLIFSDPMVDVISEIGKRADVSPFYVAFVLSPLASNASEVIASFNYAQKKTINSMSISLSTLEGAAVLNNTFVLGIFMFLILFKGLAWEFFAETASILFVQVVMAFMALKKSHTILDGIFILSLYPLSLLLVSYLESIGWN